MYCTVNDAQLDPYKHNLQSNKVLHIIAVLFLNDVHHVCISHVETQCTKQLFIAVSQKQRLPSQRHLFCFVWVLQFCDNGDG